MGRTSLKNVSASELSRELNRRNRMASALVGKRDKLASRLADLNSEIRRIGGAASMAGVGAVRIRARNSMGLVQVLKQILAKKPLGVQEAAAACIAAGYTSNAVNFPLIVNQALIKSNAFKRVSRGQYQTKSKPGRKAARKVGKRLIAKANANGDGLHAVAA